MGLLLGQQRRCGVLALFLYLSVGGMGKKPLVTSFTKWKRRPGLNTIRKWINKYPDANVGVVTGPLSGVPSSISTVLTPQSSTR